jgi:aryl-alcohol dehydrogenase-like predicted oxidoreductase
MALKKRKLGGTQVELSELTLGTWGLFAESYGKVFAEQQTSTLTRAIDLGITSFDMAPTWGPDGGSEAAVAAAVGTRRDEMTYITRAGWLAADGSLYPSFGADELRAQVESSLTRLATDRIDVLLLQHPPFAAVQTDELRAVLGDLVTEGKLRAWGASVSNADDGRTAIVWGAQVLCVPFNLLQPDIVWDLTAECREVGAGILARSPLLHGMLSGRWGEKKRFTPEDHRMYRWTYEAIEARVRQARDTRARVVPSAPSMTVAALQFVLAHDIVASAVFGPRTPAQVVSAIEDVANELPLTTGEMQLAYNSIR